MKKPQPEITPEMLQLERFQDTSLALANSECSEFEGNTSTPAKSEVTAWIQRPPTLTCAKSIRTEFPSSKVNSVSVMNLTLRPSAISLVIKKNMHDMPGPPLIILHNTNFVDVYANVHTTPIGCRRQWIESTVGPKHFLNTVLRHFIHHTSVTMAEGLPARVQFKNW